ncbi:hypothetical protein DFQ28_010422 [Apophysomyces sp. BC1034]|nr:hypothetical protein DFQ29_008785 [Apophysomyces sp. BC1021]KAG0184823.1 hypothetical protein DFQ28_010422 [Apophysomyces sp. BC1034]
MVASALLDVTPASLIGKFAPVDESGCIYKMKHNDFWARSVSLMVKLRPSTDALGPLEAISSFLSEQCPRVHGHPHVHDPIIKALYQVAKAEYQRFHDDECTFSQSAMAICKNNERIFGRAAEALHDLPGCRIQHRFTAINGYYHPDLVYLTDDGLTIDRTD